MHTASAWVGIDGNTCDTTILQTGLDFTINADKTVSYNGECLHPTLLRYLKVFVS